VASAAEIKARASWSPEKVAAFDLLMEAYWQRAAALAEGADGGGANLELNFRFSNRAFSEGRFDPDYRFA
jgi:hypothetical protein